MTSAAEDSGAVQDGPCPTPSESSDFHIGEAAGPEDMAACFAIRREVFCVEQGVSENLEIDGRDPECRHYLLRVSGRTIGTARVRPTEPGVAKIERVAILSPNRGAGLGSALMRHVLRDLDNTGCDRALSCTRRRTARPSTARSASRPKASPSRRPGFRMFA